MHGKNAVSDSAVTEHECQRRRRQAGNVIGTMARHDDGATAILPMTASSCQAALQLHTVIIMFKLPH